MRDILLAMHSKYNGDFYKIYTALASKERFTDEEVEMYISQLPLSTDEYFVIIDKDYPEHFKQMERPPFVLPKEDVLAYTVAREIEKNLGLD